MLSFPRFLTFVLLHLALVSQVLAEEIVREEFRSDRLPAQWFCESQNHAFEKDGLQTGIATGFVVPLPGHAWRSLRVELNVQGGTSIKCTSDGVLGMIVSLPAAAEPRHQGIHDQHVLAHSIKPTPAAEHTKVVFHFGPQQLSAEIGSEQVFECKNPRGLPFTGTVNLAFRGNCLVRQVRVLGDEPHAAPLYPSARNAESKPREPFRLEVGIDFPDDLIRCPFDEAMLDKLFAEMATWGVRRVHWIYTGTKSQGFLDQFPLGIAANAERTYQNVGEIFPAAVRAAHRHGIEVFALFKPFDMGLRWSYGEGTPEAASGRVQRIGGPVGWITHFAAEHRELMMARRPGAWGDATNRVWTRIELVKEDDRTPGFSVDDVQLMVSDDNVHYRPYQAAIKRSAGSEDYPVYEHGPSGMKPTDEKRRAWVMRLEGLNVREKYVAVAVKSRGKSFGNRLGNLLHVYGERGEETRLTYALAPRVSTSDGKSPADPWQAGFEFDRYPGSPTAGFGGGFDAIGEPVWLNAGTGILAIARGKEREPLAAMSPSFPAVRKHWLSWLSDAIDAGADGVELRLGNHHADFCWGEYGFEPPVRDAFLARHGVDIWQTDDFDRAAWRRLRGEGYTQFVREARELVHSRGKRFGLHVEPLVDTEPEVGGAMNIHWDWRTWLRDGRTDTVSGKSVWPGSRLHQELVSLTEPQGTPVTFVPFAVNWFSDYWSTQPKTGGEKLVDQLIRDSRARGYNAFQLYECASVVSAKSDGRVVMQEPELRAVFQRHFPASSLPKSN